MNLTIPTLVSYALAWGGSVGAVWLLFEKTEDTIREDAKRSIARWLNQLNLADFIKDWPARFAEIFDSIFGKRHLSWRCLAASCFCSSFFSIIVFFIWKAEQQQVYNLYANQRGFLTSAVGAILLVIVLNWIPDYISLLESRYIIGLLHTNATILRIAAVLIADLAITFLIWVLGLCVYLAVGGAYVSYFPNGPLTTEMSPLLVPAVYIPKVMHSAIFFTSEDPDGLSIAGIFLYTSFFTSLWVWLCGISGILVQIASKIDFKIKFLRNALDIKAKPLRSMGIVSIGIVTVAFMIMPFIN